MRAHFCHLINSAVGSVDRLDAIKRVSRTKEDKTVLVTTFHPLMPSVSKIMKKHWKVMVDNSAEMKNVFKNPSLVAYKRTLRIF